MRLPNDPGLLDKQEAELEREIEERNRLSPEARLAEVRAKKAELEARAAFLRSPEYAEQDLALREAIAGEAAAARAAVAEAFELLGSGKLDDAREKFLEHLGRFQELHRERARLAGAPVPEQPPQILPTPIPADVSAHAIEFLVGAARGGWLAYSGSRKLPPIYLPNPPSREPEKK